MAVYERQTEVQAIKHSFEGQNAPCKPSMGINTINKESCDNRKQWTMLLQICDACSSLLNVCLN